MSYQPNTFEDRRSRCESTVPTPPTIGKSEPLCIFCFKNDKSENSGEIRGGRGDAGKKYEETVTRRFFTMVHRYFVEKTGSKDFRGSRESSQKFRFLDDIEVTSCSECFVILDAYCDVYHQMKLLELELKKLMDSLWSVMSCADEGGGGPTEIGEMRRLMEFRNIFKKHCEWSHLEQFPKITLKRQENQRKKRYSSSSSAVSEPQPLIRIKEQNLSDFEVSNDLSTTPTPVPSDSEVEISKKRIKLSPPESIIGDHYDVDNDWITIADVGTGTNNTLCKTENYAGGDDDNCSDWGPGQDNEESESESTSDDDSDSDKRENNALKTKIKVRRSKITDKSGGSFECRKCRTDPLPTFTSSEKLQIHQNYLHTNGYAPISNLDNLEVLRLSETELILIGVDTSMKLCSDTYPDCAQEFILDEELKTHQTYHEEVTCDTCQVPLNYAVDMAYHELEHVKEKRETYNLKNGMISCRKCEAYSIPLEAEFINHYLKEHLNKPIIQATCPICQQNFKYVDKVPLVHYLNCHDLTRLEDASSSAVIQCAKKDCSAYFLTEDQLQLHWNSIHKSKKRTDRKYIRHKTNEFKKKCEFCDKMFKAQPEYNYHIWSQHADLKLGKPAGEVLLTDDGLTIDEFVAVEDCVCGICEMSMTNRKQLENHRLHHGEFKCNFCDEIKNLATELAVHETVHNLSKDNSIGRFRTTSCIKCPRCEFTAKNRLDYIDHHLEIHLELPSDRKRCPICRKSVPPNLRKFGSGGLKTWMVSHYMEHHDKTGLEPEKVQKCDKCPAYFRTPIQLYIHKRDIHGENIYTCWDCGKIFQSQKYLGRHRVVKHNVNPATFPFPCKFPDCGRRFEREIELDLHESFAHMMNNDKDGGVQVCSECGKTFPRLGTLLSHLKIHKKKVDQYVCPFCSKKFEENNKLFRHLRMHTKEKPFICQLCGKELTVQSALTCHLRSEACPCHSGAHKHKRTHAAKTGKLLECPICSKTWTNSYKLNRHMNVHKKEKSFICQFCGDGFMEQYKLSAHLKDKHKDEI